MSRPHPQGPRVFRSFCEPDRQMSRVRVSITPELSGDQDLLTVSLMTNVVTLSPTDESRFTISESTNTMQIQQNHRPDQPQGIDLTAFAGRVASAEGMAGSSFELPPNFFKRLNASHSVHISPSHFIELGWNHLPTMASKS